MSVRFGTANKLLAEVEGIPVVLRTVQAYVDAGLNTFVVVGHEASEVERRLRSLPLSYVLNPDFRLGQSRALVRGVGALPEITPAAVIGVGDQPFLRPAIIRALVERFESGRPLLVAPRYCGKPGNPILFDCRLFPELLAVQGDEGGRGVVRRHREAIEWIEVDDDRVGRDVDTPADLDVANRESL
jgi:molybdenum cofactor cytidylyltransferase